MFNQGRIEIRLTQWPVIVSKSYWFFWYSQEVLVQLAIFIHILINRYGIFTWWDRKRRRFGIFIGEQGYFPERTFHPTGLPLSDTLCSRM
jgi:hypothetical protein